ncbi:MAG: hypothetical protein CSA50_02555 [Gammaproteobacteria bacterium]|nr:MAG: hypothetical protein CSA50_02555 [Gammaproteobacteria bacterium]
MIRFTLRLTLLSLVVSLIVSLLLVVWVLTTSSGARLIAEMMHHLVPSIQLQVDSGNLIAGVNARYFRWRETRLPETRAIQVELVDAAVDWRLLCLVTGEVCVDRFRANRLIVSIPDSDSSENSSVESDAGLAEVSLPVAIFLANARIEQLQIITGSRITQFTEVELDADWVGSEINADRLDFGYQQVRVRSHGSFGMGNPWSMSMSGSAQGVASLIVDERVKALWDLEPAQTFRLYGEDLFLKLDMVLAGKLASDLHAELDTLVANTPFSLALDSVAKVPWAISEHQEELESWSLLLQGTLGDDKMKLSASVKDKKYGLVEAEAEFMLAESAITFARTAIHTGFGSARAKGSIALGETLSFRLDGNLDAIKLQNSPLPLALEVAGDIALEGNWQSEQFSFNALVSGLDSRFENIGGVFTGEVAVSGSPASQQLSVDLDVGSESLPIQKIDLDVQVSLPEITIEKLDVTSQEGAISVSGLVQLKERLTWQLDYRLMTVSADTWALLPEPYRHSMLDLISIEAADGDTSGFFSVENGAHSVFLSIDKLTGQLDSEPLLGSGDVRWHSTDRQLSLTGRMRAGKSSLVVAGYLSEASSHLELTLDQLLLGSLLPGTKGEISGKFTVNGAWSEPDIQGNFEATRLAFDDGVIQDVNGTINLLKLGADHSSVRVNGNSITYSGMQLESASVAIEGSSVSNEWRMMAVESDGRSGSVNCHGEQHDRFWQVDCTSLEINQFDHRWTLMEPVSFRLDRQPFVIDLPSACVAGSASEERYLGAACIDGLNWRADGFALDVSFHKIDLSFVEKLTKVKMPVRGKISGRGHLMDSQDFGIQGNIYAMTDRLVADASGSVPFTDVDMVVNLNGDSAKIDMGLETTSEGQLALSLLVDNIRTKRLVTGKVELLELDLGTLSQLFPELAEVRGSLAAQVALSGNLQNPVVAGHWHLSHGYLLNADMPVPVEDVNIDGSFSGSVMKYTGAASAWGGLVQLEGELNWRDHWYLVSTLTSSGLSLVPGKGIALTIRPDLRLKVEHGLLNLQGRVHIPEATIVLQALPKSARGISSDVVYVEFQDSQPLSSARTDADVAALDSEWNYRLDVDVSLGDRVLFKGFGVHSLLNGGIRIVQSQSGLLSAMGQVNSSFGDLTYWGQRLKIDRASMLFQGSLENPQLDVRASRKIVDESVTVGLNVTGDALHPEVEVFSEPAMDETDAAYYLLTGRKPQSGDSIGGGLVTNALISGGELTGNWITSGLFEKLGVSNFQVNAQSEAGGTSVLLSGYINPDLQLRYGVKLFDEVNSLSVRYRLGSSLFLEAMSGLNNSLDVIYSFEMK